MVDKSRANGVLKYSLKDGTAWALKDLLQRARHDIPDDVNAKAQEVKFHSIDGDGRISTPCPFKETEAVSALKAVEAASVAALVDLRYGAEARKITIDFERAVCFLFAAYICEIDGMNKAHPDVKSKLIDTDLLQAQSNLYRRLSANLYETRTPGEYFHLHGSLEATTALNMIGLEGYRSDMTDYHDAINLIESHVNMFTGAELEKMNAEKRQAGVTCLKWEDFKKTSYGESKLEQSPWLIEALETATPPVPFITVREATSKLRPLAGIRVIEMCRIIAGPAIGRTLAEYGADVIKVTPPHLSDVPFFQVDGNMGKHTLSLDLRKTKDRSEFDSLLATADVFLDGYRPGSLARLGYGYESLSSLAVSRGRGIVYISESCFGALPPSSETSASEEAKAWAQRPGWQQIADCVSGVAWAQGTEFMDLNEPVVPPFPMSDYGTGCAGTIAALTGLYNRATKGGSWWGGVSLVGYDVYLMSLGLYEPQVLESLKEEFRVAGFFGAGVGGLRHNDSVDEVGKRALKAMRKQRPGLFNAENCHEAYSEPYNAQVKYVKSAVKIEGAGIGFDRMTRPNGHDKRGWGGWEVSEGLIE
ncbi:MAG: hypothetical protein Q9195_009495 [Heterodermia aff. obscurata]